MAESLAPEVYQLHIWLRQISPMIWRRLLVRSDSTLADLHYIIQIAFDWTDFHLHCFRIHGKDYGVSRVGGPWYCADARGVRLADLQFRLNEWFLYEYDFSDGWQHQVRIERWLELDRKRTYPICIGGQRTAPPEDCGGPWVFLKRRDRAPWEAREYLWQIAEEIEGGDLDAAQDRLETLRSLRAWLTLDRFDRRQVNRRLWQYAMGDEEGRWA